MTIRSELDRLLQERVEEQEDQATRREETRSGEPAGNLRRRLSSVRAAELLHEGKTVAELAASSGLSVRQTEQLLAFYNLDPERVRARRRPPEPAAEAAALPTPSPQGQRLSPGSNQARGREIRQRLTREVLAADREAGLLIREIADKHQVSIPLLSRLLRDYGLTAAGSRSESVSAPPELPEDVAAPELETVRAVLRGEPAVASVPAAPAQGLVLTMRGEYPAARVAAYLRAAAAMVEHIEPFQSRVWVGIEISGPVVGL